MKQYIHNTVTTRVWELGDNVVRIHRSFTGEMPGHLPILTQSQEEATRCRLALDDRGTLTCQHPDCGVAFREIAGRHLLQKGGQTIHSFQLDGCNFYGFGEKTGPLEKTGERMRFGGKDACGYDPRHTDPLYKSVPFFLKLHPQRADCLGVFYHTGSDCELDIGREYNGYYPPMGQFITGERAVDLVLIFGRDMAQVLDGFTRLTGRPAMLPKYALGYLGSSMYYPELPRQCDDAIVGFVEKAKNRGIPCSNFQLSSGYTTDQRGRRNVFYWNREKFPDPKGFVEKMRDAGVTVTPNVKPAMLTTNPLYEEFANAGAFIQDPDGSPYVTRFWGGQGSFVDFSNPMGRELWKKHLKEELFACGIQSLWNDNNEFDLDGGICCNEGSPRPAESMRNVLGLLMARTGYEALTEYYPHLRPYQVSRSGCAGINRYAQVWTGDNRTSWDSLKWNIATMLCSSLSGMPLTGSDVGGFAGGAPEKELFLRWIACGCVMPRFSIHSCNDDNTVTEPWMYESATEAVRCLFQLRQQLMPYLYSLHRQVHETGAPIWRPMVWQFPEDTRCRRENVDFFLGDALLCAPVVEPGAKTRRIWLPEGTDFYDFYTGQRYEGGQEVVLDAPLDRLPLLQRGGSCCFTQICGEIIAWVAPGGDFLSIYYDDDGISREPMQTACYNFRGSHYDGKDLRLHCGGCGPHVVIALRCPDRAPCSVTADRNGLPRHMEPTGWLQGWYYDAEQKVAWIRPILFGEMTVNFSPEDLIKINGLEE